MKEPAGYTMEGVHVTYRPIGSITFDEAVARVRSAITLACSTKAKDLLVDTTTWTGFSAPDTFQRFLAAVAWAEEAGGRLRLAMVAREEMIDRERFGVMVAKNRGLVSNIFTSEEEARAWLQEKRDSSQ